VNLRPFQELKYVVGRDKLHGAERMRDRGPVFDGRKDGLVASRSKNVFSGLALELRDDVVDGRGDGSPRSIRSRLSPRKEDDLALLGDGADTFCDGE
jgi:hypothetical protein